MLEWWVTEYIRIISKDSNRIWAFQWGNDPTAHLHILNCSVSCERLSSNLQAKRARSREELVHGQSYMQSMHWISGSCCVQWLQSKQLTSYYSTWLLMMFSCRMCPAIWSLVHGHFLSKDQDWFATTIKAFEWFTSIEPRHTKIDLESGLLKSREFNQQAPLHQVSCSLLLFWTPSWLHGSAEEIFIQV